MLCGIALADITDKDAARVAGKVEWAAPMLKNNSAGRLPFCKHGIFHRLGNAKLQRGLSGNLNGFSGRRVSTFTGLSLGSDEFSESGKNKLSI